MKSDPNYCTLRVGLYFIFQRTLLSPRHWACSVFLHVDVIEVCRISVTGMLLLCRPLHKHKLPPSAQHSPPPLHSHNMPQTMASLCQTKHEADSLSGYLSNKVECGLVVEVGRIAASCTVHLMIFMWRAESYTCVDCIYGCCGSTWFLVTASCPQRRSKETEQHLFISPVFSALSKYCLSEVKSPVMASQFSANIPIT